jgi:hypothetical protein
MISRSHDDPEILRKGADYLEKHQKLMKEAA